MVSIRKILLNFETKDLKHILYIGAILRYACSLSLLFCFVLFVWKNKDFEGFFLKLFIIFVVKENNKKLFFRFQTKIIDELFNDVH